MNVFLPIFLVDLVVLLLLPPGGLLAYSRAQEMGSDGDRRGWDDNALSAARMARRQTVTSAPTSNMGALGLPHKRDPIDK